MYLIKSYEDNKVEKVNGHRGCANKRPVYVSIVTFLLCVVARIGYRLQILRCVLLPRSLTLALGLSHLLSL